MINQTCIHNRKGQNVIEYLLVSVTVIILALAFMNTQNSPMKSAVENVLEDSVADLRQLNSELQFGN